MHGAILVILLAAMATGGCTSNIRMTDITLEAGRDQMVDASGASNNTETDQLATADMKALIDAVKAALSAKKSSIIDTIKDAITGDDDEPATGDEVTPVDTGTAVSPVDTGTAVSPVDTGTAVSPVDTGTAVSPVDTGTAVSPAGDVEEVD